MTTHPGSNEHNPEERVDRDQLLDMVHERRGLPPGVEPPRRPERITHHEIKALKTSTQKDGGPLKGVAKLIGGILGGIAGVFSIFLPKGRSGSDKQTRCNLNGHVFPRNWSGDYPVCTHCGKQITSPESAGPMR